MTKDKEIRTGTTLALMGTVAAVGLTLGAVVSAQPGGNARPPTALEQLSRRPTSTMNNPYQIVENWPTLRDGMTWGAAIGIIPDNTGGTWMLFRSEPPINYIDASGTITKSFGDGLFVQAHGFCMDHDGNLWAGDSGPFAEDPSTRGRGFQLHKFSPDGELLMSLGEAGVSAAGEDTFIGPTACAVASNGDIIVADGHWPRPASAQQDGDRLVQLKTDGTFVRAVGSLGSGPGEFMGPHALAFDSDERLFVADRSNNRVQVLDENLEFVDEWRHFGRPSGVTILQDDTLIVADSESTYAIDGPPEAPEGGGRVLRNAGWQPGIRIGRAADGSLLHFVPGTRPEGLAADELGNIFAGLTGGCNASPSGGCLQKWVKAAPPSAVDVLKAEIDAVMAAPDGGADRQVKVVDVGKLNVGVGVLEVGARSTADGAPVSGILHSQVTEVYYILSGSGMLITGTEVEGNRSLAADSEVVQVAVGPSDLGTFVGGERRNVSVGDVVVIPAGVLHGWVEIPDHVRYLSIRPDPDRVLPAGYVNPAIQ